MKKSQPLTMLSWKCPDCGKELNSLYVKQLEYQKHVHQYTHKVEGNIVEVLQ